MHVVKEVHESEQGRILFPVPLGHSQYVSVKSRMKFHGGCRNHSELIQWSVDMGWGHSLFGLDKQSVGDTPIWVYPVQQGYSIRCVCVRDGNELVISNEIKEKLLGEWPADCTQIEPTEIELVHSEETAWVQYYYWLASCTAG